VTRTVLIVEDEWLIAEDHAETVRDAACDAQPACADAPPSGGIEACRAEATAGRYRRHGAARLRINGSST
jgi:hypothetical protein